VEAWRLDKICGCGVIEPIVFQLGNSPIFSEMVNSGDPIVPLEFIVSLTSG
jgi:hypothetical protein